MRQSQPYVFSPFKNQTKPPVEASTAHPSQVIPDLLVEAARHPEIADAVAAALLDGQQGVMTRIVREAFARGELPEGTDPGRALDLVVGPLYRRLAVVRIPLPEGYVDDLARSAVAALTA